MALKDRSWGVETRYFTFLDVSILQWRSLQHKRYPVIYSVGAKKKESQELQKLYCMTQLFLEFMEEIGTIRDEVVEHDIKWPGLTVKSLCRWGKGNFPSLACSCFFTEKSPPEFICSLPVTTVLLECSSSPKLDRVKNINFPFTAFHALVLPHLTSKNSWVVGDTMAFRRRPGQS